MKAKTLQPHRRRTAFSLVEVMIAGSILAVLGVGIYAFSVPISRSLLSANLANNLAQKNRNSLLFLSRDARNADAVLLYERFTGENEPRVKRRNQEGGNLLVFAYLDHENDDPSDGIVPYRSVICYFLDDGGAGSQTALYRVEVTIDPSIYGGGSDPELEDFIPTTKDNATVVFQEADGLVEGNAFYKLAANSVMVSFVGREKGVSMAGSLVYNTTLTNI